MSKHLLCACMLCISALVPMSAHAAETPKKGELTVDAGIGAGIVDYNESKALFTQRVGAEWVVAPKFISNKFTLAAGVYINNGYGAGVDTKVSGKYDYTYSIKSVSKRTGTTYQNTRRSGFGTADVNMKREDLNLLPTISLRYHANPRLDAYLSIGVGVGMMHTLMGEKKNVTGFHEDSYSHTDRNGTTRSYRYNDLDHADWGDATFTKVTAAIATYIGARYFVTDNWGINAQLGLVSANLKKSCAHSFNLFSLGASYKF